MWDDDRSALERSGLVALAVLVTAAVVAGLLAVAMALTSPAWSAPKADREPMCIGLDALADMARGRAELRIIEGAEAQRFMAAFNAAPPVTDERAERVLVILTPGALPIVEMAFESGGCVRRIVGVGLGTYMTIMRFAFGEGSS